MATVGTVIIDVKADTAKLVSGMDKAEKSIKKTVGGIQTAIISMASAYVGIQGVKAFTHMINDSLDAADATGKLAQKLGLTADALSEYQYAAGFAAVSNGELNAGLSAMIRRLNNFERSGGGAAKTALHELGISAEYARKHFTSTDIAFKEILKRLEKMPDGFKKTAIAQDIFSKSASGIMRITATDLKKFSEEAQKIGISISQSTYNMAAAYHDEMDQLDARLKGFKQTVAFSVVAPMNAASKTALEMVDNMFGSTSAEKMKNFENIAVTSIANVVYTIGFIKDAFTGVKLVITSVEHLFYTMAWGINKVFDILVTDKINDAINAYNKVADLIGKNKISNVVNQTTVDLTNKMVALSQEADALTKSLANSEGRATADEFVKKFKENLAVIKEEAKKVKPKVKTSSLIDKDREAKDHAKLITSLDDAGYKFWLKNQAKKDKLLKEAADKAKAEAEKYQVNYGQILAESLQSGIQDAFNGDFDFSKLAQSLSSSLGSTLMSKGLTQSLSGLTASLGPVGSIVGGGVIMGISSLFNKRSKSQSYYEEKYREEANKAYKSFVDALNDNTQALKDFNSNGSAVTNEISTYKNKINESENELNKFSGYDSYFYRKRKIDGKYYSWAETKAKKEQIQKNLDVLNKDLADIYNSTLSKTLDFSRLSLSQLKSIPKLKNFSLDNYNKILDQINNFALIQKERALTPEETATYTNLIKSGGTWEIGQDYADAIQLINDALKTSTDNIKSWKDSFKTNTELASDMMSKFSYTTDVTQTEKLATSMSELDKIYQRMATDADGLTDAELKALEANKALLTAQQKYVDGLNSFADGLLSKTLSSDVNYKQSMILLNTALSGFATSTDKSQSSSDIKTNANNAISYIGKTSSSLNDEKYQTAVIANRIRETATLNDTGSFKTVEDKLDEMKVAIVAELSDIKSNTEREYA